LTLLRGVSTLLRYRRNLHRQREMWRDELARLQQEVEHKQKETAYNVQVRLCRFRVPLPAT
jgi:hypothetical protein